MQVAVITDIRANLAVLESRPRGGGEAEEGHPARGSLRTQGDWRGTPRCRPPLSELNAGSPSSS
jgi:hypothetical protein